MLSRIYVRIFNKTRERNVYNTKAKYGRNVKGAKKIRNYGKVEEKYQSSLVLCIKFLMDYIKYIRCAVVMLEKVK